MHAGGLVVSAAIPGFGRERSDGIHYSGSDLTNGATVHWNVDPSACRTCELAAAMFRAMTPCCEHVDGSDAYESGKLYKTAAAGISYGPAKNVPSLLSPPRCQLLMILLYATPIWNSSLRKTDFLASS